MEDYLKDLQEQGVIDSVNASLVDEQNGSNRLNNVCVLWGHGDRNYMMYPGDNCNPNSSDNIKFVMPEDYIISVGKVQVRKN